MTWEAYLLAGLAVVLTGVSKAGFAGGLGLFGVPLIALVLSPQEAAVLLLPVLLAIDLLSVWTYRASWQARMLRSLLPGAAVGIGCGMASFAVINGDALRVGVGVMALLFVGSRFVAWSRAPVRGRGVAVFLASAASGFAGFVAHAGGPPIKGTLLGLGLDKTAFVATNALFFLALNFAKAGGYAALGLFSVEGLVASATLLPFLLVGVGVGFALHRRISEAVFLRLAYALLALAGVNLTTMGVIALLAA